MLFEYLLRWLVSWGDLIDGITGIITLGFWRTSLAYKLVIQLSRYRARVALAEYNKEQNENDLLR